MLGRLWMFDCCWMDLGWIWDGCWVDVFVGCLVDVGWMLGGCLMDVGGCVVDV